MPFRFRPCAERLQVDIVHDDDEQHRAANRRNQIDDARAETLLGQTEHAEAQKRTDPQNKYRRKQEKAERYPGNIDKTHTKHSL